MKTWAMVLMLVCFPWPVMADTLILKDGTRIETNYVWEKGHGITGYFTKTGEAFIDSDLVDWKKMREAKSPGTWAPMNAEQTKAETEKLAEELSRNKTDPGQAIAKPADDRPRTIGGNIACISEQYLDDMTQFYLNKDKGSFQAYIDGGKCVVMKENLPITVMGRSGFMWSKTEFVFKGVRFWSASEAIKLPDTGGK
jgi:hypothetical protein